jgi:hypothetical protein
MSLLDTASLVVTPNGTKAGKLYSVVPSSGAGDLDVTRATTATRVNSSGLIESVASNVPRLDYSNGSCPSILVEPQRTNVLTYSEKFDDASWLPTGATITGGILSPSGINNAWTLSNIATSGIIQKAVALSGERTFTLYAKQGTHRYLYMGAYGGVNSYANFDLLNGVVSNGANATIESVGNGWYRCTCNTISGTTGGVQIFPSNRAIGAATTNGSIYIWGAQLEAGSYATSYIPTTSASVTRNADVISKTGISSLIGQTEGTLFIDFIYNQPSGDSNGRLLQVQSASGETANSIIPLIESNNQFQITLFRNNVLNIPVFAGVSTVIPFGRNKIAIKYNSGSYTVYRNGNLFASGTGLSPLSLSVVTLGNSILVPRSLSNPINLSAVWTTALTNTQLAQLTTI